MPRLCRINLILALGFLTMPATFDHLIGLDAGSLDFVKLVVKEMAIGFFLGALIWFPIRGLEFAGVFIDTQRGATMAEDFNPVFGAQATPTAIFLSQTFSGFFFATGGFLIILTLLHKSFLIWPAHELLPELAKNALWVYLHVAAQYFAQAILLAAPIIGFMFLADIAIAFIAKKAQELNPLVFGMPVKTAIMLVMLVFYVEIAYPEVMRTLEGGIGVFESLFADE